MKTDSYLGNLIRKVTGSEVVEVAQSADLAELQVTFDAFKTNAEEQLVELSTSLEAALATIALADVEKTALEAKLAAAEAAVVTAEQAKATLASDAEAKRIAQRKEKIVAAVGTATAEATFAATASLADEHFETVLAGFKVAGEVEGNSRFFTAQGADVEVDATLVTQGESPEMRILKEMFPTSSEA